MCERRIMKSSWQDYVDEALLSSGFVAQAALFGQEKCPCWATSKGFDVTSLEIKTISKAFIEPELFVQCGFTLDQKHYTLVRSNTNTIMGKCHGGGCVVVKCGKVLIVAVYDDNLHASSCVNLVAKLADYLGQQNF